MIQVYEPGSDDERMMMSLLAQSKKWIEEKRPVHAAALCRASEVDIVALAGLGDWNEPHVRIAASQFLRKLVKEREATFFAFITDTFITTFKGGREELARAGLDPREYKSWSKKNQERFGMRRREALVLLMESKGSPTKALIQHYQRKGGMIIWEEITTDNSGSFTGRFTNMFGDEP